MAHLVFLWLLLAIAPAILSFASAAYVNVTTVHQNLQFSANPSENPHKVARRSFFIPNRGDQPSQPKWFSNRRDHGRELSILSYCWVDDGDVQQKQWIEEALNDTWNRLQVVQFLNVGLCQPSFNIFLKVKLIPAPLTAISSDSDQFYNGTIQLVRSFSSVYLPVCDVSDSTRERCIKKTAVHEFGHALGLQHEQYRPDTPSRLNREWCVTNDLHQKADVLRRHPRMIGPWDEYSVMNYCNPEYWNRTEIQPLSVGDRAAVLSVYGRTVHFNSSCNMWNILIMKNPLSAACRSAVQRYCETVHEDVKNVIGIVRGVTSNGLDVTCFKADFIQQVQDDRAELVSENLAVKGKQPDGDRICRNWAGSLVPEKNNFKRYVDLPIDMVGTGRPTVCKESIWHGSLDAADLTSLAQAAKDFRCLTELHSKAATVDTRYNLVSCAALADLYCEQHKNGSAGKILKFTRGTVTMEIVCFQALLKIELYANQVY